MILWWSSLQSLLLRLGFAELLLCQCPAVLEVTWPEVIRLMANGYKSGRRVRRLGLTLPWQRWRTSKAERSDLYLFVHDVLRFNVGKGIARISVEQLSERGHAQWRQAVRHMRLETCVNRSVRQPVMSRSR